MKKTKEVQETLTEYPESSAISQDIVTSNFKKFLFSIFSLFPSEIMVTTLHLILLRVNIYYEST